MNIPTMTPHSQSANEKDVQNLYEEAPYPDLGADLKDPISIIRAERYLESGFNGEIRYLEAGCGTGHYLVGIARRFPDWRCAGVDLSSSSLAVARELASIHNAPNVAVHQASYLDDLPFEKQSFDVISAQGTIHHCDDPMAALKNLREYLKPGGICSMHIYGKRLDQSKFDMKEAISIFEPDLFKYKERFDIYKKLIEHQKNRERLRAALDLSPLKIARWLRRRLYDLRRRRANVSWSPPWTADYASPTAPWRDHFCHPCERAYEVPDVQALVTGAGFRVVEMTAQGAEDIALVPPNLRTTFATLDPWARWRLMELLSPSTSLRRQPQSFSMVLKKA